MGKSDPRMDDPLESSRFETQKQNYKGMTQNEQYYATTEPIYDVTWDILKSECQQIISGLLTD